MWFDDESEDGKHWDFEMVGCFPESHSAHWAIHCSRCASGHGVSPGNCASLPAMSHLGLLSAHEHDCRVSWWSFMTFIIDLNPLPTFNLYSLLWISWFLEYRFLWRCRNLEFTIAIMSIKLVFIFLPNRWHSQVLDVRGISYDASVLWDGQLGDIWEADTGHKTNRKSDKYW